MKQKLEILIEGIVFGFQYPDESLADARARILLTAEQNGNSGPSRLHLHFSELPQELANLCDRHKRARLPQPTTMTCADCKVAQNGKPLA